MELKLNTKIKKMFAIGMFVVGISSLTACQRGDGISTHPAGDMDTNTKVSFNNNAEENDAVISNISEDKSDTSKNVVITYEDAILTVESITDTVRLDSNGLHVNGAKGNVDISLDGIKVVERDSNVEITKDGIKIKDADDSINISLPEIKITDGETGESFSLSTFLGKNIPWSTQENFNWLDCDNISLLDRTTILNGKKENVKIFIQDGYLVTKNCDEKNTTVNGLTLVKTETDTEGNIYRYYKDKTERIQ